jgi:hypothetical protein
MTTFRHFVTTWPRKNTCPKCQRTVLDGIAEGFPYRVDPIPLDLTAEITAELAGRRTYWTTAGHIVCRTFDNITVETPDTRPPVFATHHCAPPDPHHIAINHIPVTQQLITDKYLEKATPEQDTDQQALITIADVLAGRVTESPDDQDPPF